MFVSVRHSFSFSLSAPVDVFLAARAALRPAACPVRGLRSARPKSPLAASRSLESSPDFVLPSKPSFANFLIGIPAVPVHGSSDIPVRVLHDWRAELVAAQSEYLFAESAYGVAVATMDAADAEATAAAVRAKAAASDFKVAGARFDEANKRQKLAWAQYLELVSTVCLETAGEPAGSRSVALRRPAVGDKGKARASSRASAGEDEILGEDEEFDSDSGGGDIMVE